MNLAIGEKQGGGKFTLPGDAVARTFAIIGQRGSGKSSLATVIAEEMCKASLPWVALDPVGVWWGLRARAQGAPDGFPVVVFGGERGDLPLDKGSGRKIAEACIAANVFAVIDLSRDSKTAWRTIVRDFCHALQELRPDHPRHVFLEEAPEFVPQRPSHQLGAECKEIVERLVRLGRNWGYGATVLSQRPATIDKDVLSQCESLFVMRTSGAHDRAALKDWIKANATEAQLDEVLGKLATLPDGGAWFWSPQWMGIFEQIQVRRRETFHPGETRTVGGKARSVELVDVKSFVEKVRKQLTKTTAAVPAARGTVRTMTQILHKVAEDREAADRLPPPARQLNDQAERILELERGLAAVQGALRVAEGRARDAERRLEVVRAHLRPQWEAMAKLFGEIGSSAVPGGSVDRGVFEPWLQKAGQRGCRRMLEILIERPELTKPQLGTLSSVSHKSSTFRGYMAWLRRNGLIETEGDTVKLRAV